MAKTPVVVDGSCGEPSSVLEITPDYIMESWNAYGANAAFEIRDRSFITAFHEGVNVIAEEVARMINFDTGSGINLGLRDSESSEELIYRIAAAMDQNDIFEVLFAEIRL